MVGQLQNAGRDNTKTILEENELGKSVRSKTKHTLLGLKTIRTNKSFTKTIKKENRLTTLKPITAKNILQEARNNANNSRNNKNNITNNPSEELSNISKLLLRNQITLNKPIIAHTKKNTVGIFEINKSTEDKNKTNIKKLYDLRNKTTNIKKRIWLKNTGEEQLNSNNLNKIYYKTAKNILDRNARVFNVRIKSEI
jgi:hypothetical protein